MKLGEKVENLVVHRIVEQHAASRGDTLAVVDAGRSLTYRDLNHAANRVARHLLDHGFRRGGHALVSMTEGTDLSTVLLAILKAGGSYTWTAPLSAPGQRPLALANGRTDDLTVYAPMDVAPILHSVGRAPNLPILARPSDIACVLPAAGSGQGVLVPHSTITALRREASAAPQAWDGESTTFEMWMGLMSGSTLRVAAAPALLNAA